MEEHKKDTHKIESLLNNRSFRGVVLINFTFFTFYSALSCSKIISGRLRANSLKNSISFCQCCIS